jgi:hypothetical protein
MSQLHFESSNMFIKELKTKILIRVSVPQVLLFALILMGTTAKRGFPPAF